MVAGDTAVLCVAGVAWRHPPSFHVAVVALGDIDLHFAWQAWRLVTLTCILRGRRGTCSTGLALVAPLGTVIVAGDAVLCVGVVALGDIHLLFAWPAWHLATLTCILRGRRRACGTGMPLVARLGVVSRR